MSAEDEDSDEDLVEYELEPLTLIDGEFHIFDPVEFAELYRNPIAVMAHEGALFYLDRDSRKWTNVEQPTAKPRRVQ
jgi:hypothetical protein